MPASSLRFATLLVLALGSFVITRASLVYFDPDVLAPFVIEKLPLPLEEVWLFALKAHVVSAAFALPACLVLTGKTLMRRAPRAHRWLGRVSGLVVLLVLVPSGFYLALFAKGGVAGTVGFMLSGVIVALAMVRGIATARAGKYAPHRRWAFHVLAQLSVAVSSRLMLFTFDAANFDPEAAYLISLWVPVLGSAAAVELLVPRAHDLLFPWRKHEALPRAHHHPALHARVRDAAGV